MLFVLFKRFFPTRCVSSYLMILQTARRISVCVCVREREREMKVNKAWGIDLMSKEQRTFFSLPSFTFLKFTGSEKWLPSCWFLKCMKEEKWSVPILQYQVRPPRWGKNMFNQSKNWEELFKDPWTLYGEMKWLELMCVSDTISKMCTLSTKHSSSMRKREKRKKDFIFARTTKWSLGKSQELSPWENLPLDPLDKHICVDQ